LTRLGCSLEALETGAIILLDPTILYFSRNSNVMVRIRLLWGPLLNETYSFDLLTVAL
jgi:hypothetical protein